MSKKGSLSLSVNAIVILIIAITMLGLGLGFVRMLFGGAMDKFETILENEQDPPSPSSSNTITLSREVVIANPGDDEAIKAALYNPTSADWSSVSADVDCPGLTAFSSQSNSKNIATRESAVFGVLLKIPKNAVEDTYLCQLNFIDDAAEQIGYSTDFTIQVRYK